MEMITKKNKLFDEVLLKPAYEADELIIISGFATSSMLEYNISKVRDLYHKDLSIKILIGMIWQCGISRIQHENFVKLHKANRIDCSYISDKYPAVNSKIYLWRKKGVPVKAYCSSADYTLTGFLKDQKEIAIECKSDEALKYYENMLSFSLYCDSDEASEYVKDVKDDIFKLSSSPVSVCLPLFSLKQNKVCERSGLNWGQRNGRNPNQAYIPLPSEHREFFPKRSVPFSVLTKDGYPFVCKVAQDTGKAIESSKNSELGEYFRSRLGLGYGEKVTLEHLDNFGTRYVKFTKISEEEYYMEFERGVELELDFMSTGK